MSTQSDQAPLAPMKMIRRLLNLLRSRGEDGLELDVITRQVTREEETVTKATCEARTIENTFGGLSTSIPSFLSDERSPGVIDHEELADLIRQIHEGSRQAHGHTRTLEALT